MKIREVPDSLALFSAAALGRVGVLWSRKGRNNLSIWMGWGWMVRSQE